MKYSPIIFLVLLLSSCGGSGDDNGKKSFEGFITYDVSITYQDTVFQNESGWYYDQKYGTVAELYIGKDGSLKRICPNSGEKGFEYNGYDPSENITYAKWRDIDSIYVYDSSTNALNFVSKRTSESESILNKPCKVTTFIGTDVLTGDTITQSYYYSNELYLNPAFYTDNLDFFTDEIYAEMQAPYLKLKIDFGPYVVTYVAKSIEAKELDSEMFSFPVGMEVAYL